ncbi:MULTISPECIES: hypothetical protein [unclassified Halorhabdus]|uniref:hypothetical protein n=1 Tax=unclassified Halorhabdus TaxID=2621901 RepID=UPI0023DBB114|nr:MULTISPECIES: hypothetical protein [unclassified Halorhabdus]WEL16695.1 Membrane-bound metal-dependent hydrolase YbcI, DUF457 family [Halorhabdus sp. SVX81]WEL20567.1 Membrane-bound metal-dependent hydrolase YbcI, DUF457 family [Halorhabdus sp. BNX81]
MADLLSTVLVTYAAFTVASWRIDGLDRRWIVVAMGGAAIPDLVKVQILVDADVIGNALGVPFSYSPVASIAGVVVVAGIIALFFGEQWRRQAYAVLLASGGFSLVIDGLRVYADGFANFYLYPLWIRPPTPGLFVSADPAVLVVALLVSGVTFGIDRWLTTNPS